MASDSIIPTVIAAAASVTAAGGAAFLGAWLSPRRYRSEKLWDRKMEVYYEIFNAINEMEEEFDALLDEAVEGRRLSPEQKASLTEATNKARYILRKQSRIGAFLITEEAERSLKSLLTELDSYEAKLATSYFDYIDMNAAMISDTDATLKEIARRDLKI